MIEEIIKKIVEVIDVSTNIRLSENGGFSAYASSGKIIARFIGGGELHNITVTLKGKGKNPSELFEVLEGAYSNVLNSDINLFGHNWELASLKTLTPPVFEKSSENDLYLVACSFSVDFLVEVDD